MANLQFEDFCQKVCQMLRWKAARGPVSAELTAHLEPSRYIGRCPEQVAAMTAACRTLIGADAQQAEELTL